MKNKLAKALLTAAFYGGSVAMGLVWYDWKLLVILFVWSIAHNIEKH